MADNKSIKFPAKHYVGFQGRNHEDLPLGFMTPHGTDKAFEKRKTTVDNWAAGGYYGTNSKKTKFPAQVYDNKPLVGFKLGKSVSHSYGWGQGNVKWRIEDPRGFELEITSPNLAQILGFCTIDQGVIQEQCIWARYGADNILVPVNSDVYQSATKNTERMSKKASLKDLNIGDTAIMHNGDVGIYYGAMYMIRSTTEENYVSKSLEISDKKKHVFLMTGADGLNSTKFFRAIASPKLSEVYEGTPMTPHEAELDIEKKVREEEYTVTENTNSYRSSVIAFTVDKVDISTRTITRHDDNITRVVAETIKKHPSSFSQGGYIPYYVRNEYNNAFELFEVDGVLVHMSVGEVLSKRDYLPGGKLHANAVAAATNYQNNMSRYGSAFGSKFKPMDEVNYLPLKNDPSVEGHSNIGNENYGYNGRHDRYPGICVDKFPDEFHYYSMDLVTPAGQKIVCYC